MKRNGVSPIRAWWNKRVRSVPLLLLVAGIIAVGFSALFFYRVTSSVPGYAELRDIRHHEASSIYTSDGVILGRYYEQNRDGVELEEINPQFIDALLAIEDVRFYDHRGIDYRALARVFVRTILLQQDAGGGSTLSQQLAKNLYPRERHGSAYLVFNKMREVIIAHRMERLYSKEEILELYVNTVSFGEDTWGIKTASERFFNTAPDQLELHQAATLAGLLRATTWYNPRRNPGNAMQRRNLVIRQMERYGMINSDESEEARSRPLDLDYRRLAKSEGSAPHFRAHLRSHIEQILATEPSLDGRHYNVDTDGLVIKTTIDSRLQSIAEYAVETHLAGLQDIFDRYRDHKPVFHENHPVIERVWRGTDRYKSLKELGYDEKEINRIRDEPVSMEWFTWDGMKTVTASPRDSIRHYLSFLNAGFLAMHPETGDIKAWVGGIPDKRFQYDHVRSRRQTGSAFKPIVYAAALEAGVEPCDYRRNLLSTYASFDEWTPSNLQEEYGGHYSIQAALARSVNTISVELLMETGIEEVRETARKMGIHSPVPNQPSIALGTAELSLLEMTQAYSTFANRGVPAVPRLIKAIYNSRGQLIYDFRDSATPVVRETDAPLVSSPVSTMALREQAISEETAAAMVNMLARSVDSGSAAALRSRYGIRHAVAGKTGTTQNFSDGWFVGMTPDLVFGSWVGGTFPSVQLSEEFGFASQTALPVAGLFLQEYGRHDNLEPVPDRFHPHQINSGYPTACDDYRDERFTDRVRDFFSGRDSQEAQIIDDEEDDRSVLGRIRSLFSSD